MDLDMIVIFNCGSILDEYLVMHAEKITLRARERRNCVIIGLSIPYTALEAIPNVLSP